MVIYSYHGPKPPAARIWIPIMIGLCFLGAFLEASLLGLLSVGLITANALGRIHVSDPVTYDGVAMELKNATRVIIRSLWHKRTSIIDFVYIRRCLIITQLYFIIILFDDFFETHYILSWLQFTLPLTEPIAVLFPPVTEAKIFFGSNQILEKYPLICHAFSIPILGAAMFSILYWKDIPGFFWGFRDADNPAEAARLYYSNKSCSFWIKGFAVFVLMSIAVFLFLYGMYGSGQVNLNMMSTRLCDSSEICARGYLMLSTGLSSNSYLLSLSYIPVIFFSVFLPVAARALVFNLSEFYSCLRPKRPQ